MPGPSASTRKAADSVHLLDGNVLYALIDQAHVHHAPARQWFSSLSGGFATCPVTQGTLVRLVMRLGGHGVEQALALLGVVTAHAKHHFWPDMLPYDKVRWHGVMGHRQVTDAYLAGFGPAAWGQARQFRQKAGRLHPDVGVAVEP